jgi:CSLREA domain-containing protein
MRRSVSASLHAIAALAIVFAGTGRAATFIVETLADDQAVDGRCTLREAVAAHNAASGANDCGTFDAGADVIVFAVTGTILLDSSLGELVLVAPAVTLDGPGRSLLTLHGQDAMSILVLDSALPPALTVRGLTLSNGRSVLPANNPSGGAIRAALTAGPTAAITVEDAALVDNVAAGDPAFVSTRGGAIRSTGTLVLRRTSLRRNSAQIGGAVDVTGDALVEDCDFTDNVAMFAGGAMRTHPAVGCAMTVRRSLFQGNAAQQQANGLGAAIQFGCVDGTLTVESSTFQGQRGGDGSVVHVTMEGADALVRNSTFADNHAAFPLVQNGVVHLAGASSANVATLTVESSLFAADDRPAVRLSGVAGAATVSTAYNLFDTGAANLPAGTTCAGSTAGGANLCGVAAPGLDPLAANGGPTATMALQPGSPAIDAGSNPGALATDQRGFERTAGAATDIGAFESGAACVKSAVAFASAAFTVVESGGTATITVERTGTCAIVVAYATSDGSATAPADYAATSGSLAFPEGGSDTLASAVPIVSDALVEGNETLSVSLTVAQQPPQAAPLTIVDDDLAITPIPTLGEWGLALLGLALAALGCRRLAAAS